MRIVGGAFRSRVLCEFDGENIRPTSDKVRESLFNILGNRVYGSRVLDVFSGTGAIGIEALSRGARFVRFNDKAKSSRELLKKNLKLLKVEDGYEITEHDGVDCLKTAKTPFDIIYIDPPYKTDLGLRALNVASQALSDGGIIVFEDEKPFEGQIDGLKITKEKKYGRVRLTFFEKEE